MSSVFLISHENDFFALDVTTDVAKSQSNSLTKSSVMDGTNFSDGFTIGNPSISFSGICNYNKIDRGIAGFKIPNPKEFSVLLDKMIASFQRFTLYGNKLIPNLDNVVITNYQITQNKYSDAMEVSLTVEQVFVSERAQEVRLTKPSKATSSDLDVTEKTDSGDGSKTEVEEEAAARTKSYLSLTYSGVSDFFNPSEEEETE